MKVSRSLFYKEKESIRFFLGEGDTLERSFLNKLRKRPFMNNLDNASTIILRLFNNACYICSLVYYEDYPLLELKEYEKIAIDDHDDSIWINHIAPATMALTVNWLRADESQKVLAEKGRLTDIEEFCKEICMSIEENETFPCESQEDFQALVSCKHRLPSGFIGEGGFLRRTLSETLEDNSVELNDIFGNISSLEYLASIMMNLDEVISTFGPDSNFVKNYPKPNYSNISEKLIELKNILNKNFNDAAGDLPIREEAYNMQTGLPCFTNRQMGILMTAVGRITEKGNSPGKTTIGDVVQRIAGYKTTTVNQNMKGGISEADKKIVADVLKGKFPRLAEEVLRLYT